MGPVSDSDYFPRWALYLALAVPISLFADAFSRSFQDITGLIAATITLLRLMFWLLAVPWLLITAIVLAYLAVRATWHRRLKRAISYSLLPGLIACTAIWPQSVFSNISWAANLAHFLMLRQSYAAKLDLLAPSDKPRLVWFFWRDASAALDGMTLEYLVFDESDEFSLPNDKRSAAWKTRAFDTYVKLSGFPDGAKMPDNALHLTGHYYVVDLHW